MMAKYQGNQKLLRSYIRTFKPHETQRGYVFISKDKHLPDILETKSFEVQLGSHTFSSRRIDKFGRIQIPKRYLIALGTDKRLRFSLVSRTKLKVEPLG